MVRAARPKRGPAKGGGLAVALLWGFGRCLEPAGNPRGDPRDAGPFRGGPGAPPSGGQAQLCRPQGGGRHNFVGPGGLLGSRTLPR